MVPFEKGVGLALGPVRRWENILSMPQAESRC